MQNQINVATAPKTGTFQMRINPEVRQEVEAVYASYGLSLTDAINVFLQQSLNESGLPFLLSPENAAYLKTKATARLAGAPSIQADTLQKTWQTIVGGIEETQKLQASARDQRKQDQVKLENIRRDFMQKYNAPR